MLRAGVLGAITAAILWIPFLPFGPVGYLRNLGTYQNEIFNVLSLRAWNPWWILQTVAAGGDFIRDDVAFIGPLTLRHVGYLVTAALSVLIGLAIIRDPRPRTFILGVVASVLAIFTWMTQMHERYAYAALIVVLLLIPERPVRWFTGILAVVFTLNLLAAVPATPTIAAALPTATEFFGPIVLEHARAAPDDPRVPQALHRLVFATRHSCETGPGELSRAAFRLLHARYPDSEWAEMTPYWYQ